MQPCKLYFSEPGIGGWAGTAAGRGEDETEKKRSKVGKTPAGGEKKCGGMGSVTTTTDSMMSSDVPSVRSLYRHGGPGEGGTQQQGDEEGSKRESCEEHVLTFYRGICACAEHVRVRAVRAMHAARLDKSAFARPRATLCASAFLQVVVAFFSEVRKR